MTRLAAMLFAWALALGCAQAIRSMNERRPYWIVSLLNGARSSQVFAFFDCPIVYEADRDRAAGHSAAHALAEMQRRAPRERCVHGVAINIAYRGRRIVARIGHARRRDHLTITPEGEAYRVLHAVTRLILGWRHPAGAQIEAAASFVCIGQPHGRVCRPAARSTGSLNHSITGPARHSSAYSMGHRSPRRHLHGFARFRRGMGWSLQWQSTSA